MFPLFHDLCSRRAEDEEVRRARSKHQEHRHASGHQVVLREYSPEPRVLRELTSSDLRKLLPGPCEREQDRKGGLEREVGREDGLLERRERRSRKGLEGERAAEECLEEVAAQEGAVG